MPPSPGTRSGEGETHLAGLLARRHRRFMHRKRIADSIEPKLTPERRELARAHKPAGAIQSATDHTVENDARRLHFDHLACSLVDDVSDGRAHPSQATAIRNHFRVERKSPIPTVFADRIEDFLLGFDAHELTAL